MTEFTIAGRRFLLERRTVEEAAIGVLPEPVREHYVVVRGRRFPPKQIMSRVTGLDRADFTTHQARRILKRLGFIAATASLHSRKEKCLPSSRGLTSASRCNRASRPGITSPVCPRSTCGLIAEWTSGLLCADLGITAYPRPDDAH